MAGILGDCADGRAVGGRANRGKARCTAASSGRKVGGGGVGAGWRPLVAGEEGGASHAMVTWQARAA